MIIQLWNLPKEKYDTFKKAWDERNLLWLVSFFNQYNVTSPSLCAACPDSIDIVEKEMPKWFDAVEKEL